MKNIQNTKYKIQNIIRDKIYYKQT
jgi:hypothetical protein